MHRVNRACLPAPSGPRPAPTGPQPTVTRSQGARHAAPPSLLRAAARPTRPTIPRAPRPRIRPTARAPALRPLRSIAYALLPAARVPLCRHRADPESSSRSLPSGSSARIAPIAPTARIAPIAPAARRCPRSPSRVASAPGPDWQESHRMHPFFAECAKKAPFLATSARNACFSRSRWQHSRPMHPFPGAIGRFRIHGARILPPRAHFRVEEPEITHDAKMLPAPRGLSAAAACGPAEWALRHAAAACDTRHGRTGFAPCGAGLACLPHARPLPSRLCPPPAFIAAVLHASRFAARIASAAPPIAVGMSCRSGSSCRPRAAHADASRPSMRARRHRLGPNPRQPSPGPEPTGPQPRANRASPARGAVCAHPRPATRRASPCRAGSAAVPVIPAKWCGDTIAHTRKLRF